MTAATLAPPDGRVFEVEPVHVAALAELTTITDRVRYACEHGPGPRTDLVRQWLAAYGIETRRPYVSTLVNGYRANQDMTDTGELPALTDDALADLDRGAEPDHPAPDAASRRHRYLRDASPPAVDDASPVASRDTSHRVATDDPAEPEPEARRDGGPAAVATPDPEPAPEPADLGQLTPAVETPQPAPPAVATHASPDLYRVPKPAAVVALTISTAAASAGIAAATRTSLSAAQAWPWPLTLSTGLVTVTVLLMLTWSTASVLGSLTAGRTARDLMLNVASWTVAGISGFLAAYGQVAFAEWAGAHGNIRFLVPGILEPSVVVLLLLANRRVRRRLAGLPAKPVGKILALAALLGAFAVYTNVVHAGHRLGMVFGAATVVGLILWWVKLNDDAAPEVWDDAPHSKRLSRRTSRYRLLRWLILPGQTRRAWLISLDHSIADAETGLQLARHWRRAYDESREAHNSRRLARRHAAARIDAQLRAS